MKLKVRITESQLEELRKKYGMSSESSENTGTTNEGKFPYVKKGFLFIKLDPNKSIPASAHYLSTEDAAELNQMGQDLESLKVSYSEKLKSLTGENDTNLEK